MKLAVLGAAESGAGAGILARKMGYDVLVSDAGAIKPQYKELLSARGVRWEEGGHDEAWILSADEVVKSPGIPDTAPLVARLRAKGTPVVSEIEFAGRYTDARMVCITGSNGKTTTTSLVYHLLQKAGIACGLAGNIGRSLALQVAESPQPCYVIELSSFQLDDMYRFRADIAVLLNITPDHLDRYDFEMRNYVASKMRILQNQRPDDTFIYWAEDEYIPAELGLRRPQSRLLPFSDADFADGTLHIATPVAFSVATDRLSLRGRHNWRNCAAAAMAALAAGASTEAVAAGLADFPGVEHRLEAAGEVDGVEYINDSKATNVDACRVALEAMTRPTVLIVGGLDKGNDYATIADLVREKCRALVYLGADNTKLHAAFDPLGLPVADTNSMAACIEACRRLSQPGDAVLLSPCCASFDLFTGMADRGRQFKNLVRQLIEKK